MQKRIALLMSAVLAGSTLAGAALAADECLTGPKGLAPAGKHWYYNTDRKAQRKCWYLDDAGEKVVAATPRKQPVATAPSEPSRRTEPTAQNADARAELVDVPRSEQAVAPLPAAPSVSQQLPPSQDTADGEKKGDWSVASRWPEASDTFATSFSPVIADAAPTPRSERPSLAVAAAPVAQSPAIADGEHGVDFGLIAAGLILLVVVGGTIMILRRRSSPAQGRSPRRAIDRGEMPWSNRAAARSTAPGLPSEISSSSDVIEEVEQLLDARRQARDRQALTE